MLGLPDSVYQKNEDVWHKCRARSTSIEHRREPGFQAYVPQTLVMSSLSITLRSC